MEVDVEEATDGKSAERLSSHVVLLLLNTVLLFLKGVMGNVSARDQCTKTFAMVFKDGMMAVGEESVLPTSPMTLTFTFSDSDSGLVSIPLLGVDDFAVVCERDQCTNTLLLSSDDDGFGGEGEMARPVFPTCPITLPSFVVIESPMWLRGFKQVRQSPLLLLILPPRGAC